MNRNNPVVECLDSGGVVLIPTDTVYGLAAKPNIHSALTKIYELKSRPRNMHLPIMVASGEYFEELGLEVNEYTKKLLNSNMIPGAITIVLGFNTLTSRPTWLKGRDEVAIRIPNDKRLLGILCKTGPLLVTSANKHGSTYTPNNVSEILEELHGKPDLVINGGLLQEFPSTIINCRFDPPKIEREGVVSSKQVFSILDNEE